MNILTRCALVALSVCLGLVLIVDVASAQCPMRGTVEVDEVSNSKGKPYEAKEIRTIVTYGKDGQKDLKVTKSNLFRDGGGRIRIERFYDGTADPSEAVPTDVTIDDNCGISVILLPSRQTAKVTKMVLPKQISEEPSCKEVDLKNPPYTGLEGKVEDLGHKLVDGVEIRGERISYYSSARAKQSGAPAARVYENWCSISLETRMGGYILNDQPKREITTVISNVRQVEPDATLFEIPKEYKIIRAEASGSVADPVHSELAATPD